MTGQTPAAGAEMVVRRSEHGWQVGGEEAAARLAMTMAQLEYALAARVRVEQAIGVLAARHRVRPRQAFDLLRNVARSGGGRVIEIAETVVASTSTRCCRCPRRWPGPRPRRASAVARPGTPARRA